MSEFKVEVVELKEIVKHHNADTLSITKVYDYPVIIRTGDFKEGDRAVYVPVDSVVPSDDSRWEFLDGHWRIRAKRLRGVFSMGILTPAKSSWEVGQDVREELRIVKYEPPENVQMGAEDEKCPFDFPHYTDIEGYRRWTHILQEGEEVVATEKIHGANGRWMWHDGRLWVGSHHNIKRAPRDRNPWWKKFLARMGFNIKPKFTSISLWWKVAEQYRLAEILSQYPDIVFFGEVYGRVQDLHYGTGPNEYKLALFDCMDWNTHRYYDADEFSLLAARTGLPTVPILYRGSWSEAIRTMANGKSKVEKSDNIREGFVVRPVKERWDDKLGRVILKLVGEDYLLRKEK